MAVTTKMSSEICHRVVWYKSTNVMAEPAVSIVKVSLIKSTDFFKSQHNCIIQTNQLHVSATISHHQAELEN
jgi:hypothetical protein